MKLEHPRSQAGQDQFVGAVLDKRDGTFIEIGCSHPIELSNTYALEQELGWRGIMVDLDPNAIVACQRERISRAFWGDATKCDWPTILASFPPKDGWYDYLSLDVDEASYLALVNLMKANPRFRVITAEHDAYQRGDRLRVPMRELLRNAGYEIMAHDVHSNGCAFEDWHVHPEGADMVAAQKFFSYGMDWQDVLISGGVL